MPELVRMQMKQGISKFKCATIAEAEMVAACNATDILLAMQPVGPNLERFFRLKREFDDSDISCIADDAEIIDEISAMAVKTGLKTRVWLDINVGMNRTGVVPGKKAEELYLRMMSSPMLVAAGLHVYDGHIHEHDLSLRRKMCNDAFAPVTTLLENLRKKRVPEIDIVAGGTPSFPVHAEFKRAELSPGTLLLWGYGYSESFRDMNFLHAAVLLTRVVSKPAEDLLCMDLGHKAVASEMPHPRIKILGMDNYFFTEHNEEHLVIRTPEASKYKTGDVLYCIPWHICPTMDRHDFAVVIINNEAVAQWKIEARKRKITI
jgi:D-serine deaminase-like pyridoxal phosphate-dependent protein